MQVQTAAEYIVAAGNDHSSSPALALLDLIQGQMHRADNADIDRVARRALYRQSRYSVGNRERQTIHAPALLTNRQPAVLSYSVKPPFNRPPVLRSCPLTTVAARRQDDRRYTQGEVLG